MVIIRHSQMCTNPSDTTMYLPLPLIICIFKNYICLLGSALTHFHSCPNNFSLHCMPVSRKKQFFEKKLNTVSYRFLLLIQ